jgi:hypothetical protein
MIGVATQRRPRGRPRGRRPGHPRDGTVREDRRAAAASTAAGAMAAKRRHPTQAQRRRTGHPGGHASPARVHLPGPLAPPRRPPPGTPVPRPAPPSRLQQAPAWPGRVAALRDPGGRHRPSLWTDDVWIIDSTPVECGRSRETTKPSALAGWAQYGYCASHSRYFWGLRLHLVCTLHGLPVAFALTGAKADEREVLVDLLRVEPELVAARPARHCWRTSTTTTAASSRGLGRAGGAAAATGPQGRTRAAWGAPVQAAAAADRVGQRHLQGPARPGAPRRPHPGGVAVRVLQRLLALAAAIWHNHKTGQPILRSLVAYDH